MSGLGTAELSILVIVGLIGLGFLVLIAAALKYLKRKANRIPVIRRLSKRDAEYHFQSRYKSSRVGCICDAPLAACLVATT